MGLVLHQGAIGDFVLTLSVIQALRSALPVSRVVAIASAASARLAAGRSVIDECIALDMAGVHTLFSESMELDARLDERIRGAAWVLSCLGDERAAVSRRLTERCSGVCVCIDPRALPDTLRERRHITQQWTQDIRREGVVLDEPTAPWIAWKRTSDPAISASGRRVVMHPGSGAREKCWPFERFLELADRLTDAHVLWLLGPAEIERRPDWHEILRSRTAADAQEALMVEPDIVEAAEQVAGADLYMGNDGGMTHVAAALGVPTVAVFGPTDPNVWRPLNPNTTVVSPAELGPVETVGLSEVLQAVRAAGGDAG